MTVNQILGIAMIIIPIVAGFSWLCYKNKLYGAIQITAYALMLWGGCAILFGYGYVVSALLS